MEPNSREGGIRNSSEKACGKARRGSRDVFDLVAPVRFFFFIERRFFLRLGEFEFILMNRLL